MDETQLKNAWDCKLQELETLDFDMRYNLIQSYVAGRWFVSTTYRRSSAMIEPPANWYFETIAWEWDPNTKTQGRIIKMDDSGSSQEEALLSHINICSELLGIV